MATIKKRVDEVKLLLGDHQESSSQMTFVGNQIIFL